MGPRRFRANMLLDGTGEDALLGSTIAVGDTLLHIGGRIQRCVMVTRPQPGEIDHDPNVLRTISRERPACLAVGAIATRSGIVRVGDEIRPADTQAV